jgi:hypothetical protein
MDPAVQSLEAPTAELLLDVRTPAELTFSPDGSRIAACVPSGNRKTVDISK